MGQRWHRFMLALVDLELPRPREIDLELLQVDLGSVELLEVDLPT